MTIERRIVVGLGDIKAVSFQCSKCEYRISMSPDKVHGIPAHRPDGHDWVLGKEVTLIVPPLLQFTETLARLRTLAGQKVLGFEILFEFDEEKTS
jgi:hypothetical protein